MKINSWMLGLIVIAFIFGGIGVSSAMGNWQTESTKIPAKYASGEFAGQYNPADIRGSYSFGEISELFKVPLSDLGMAFGINSSVNLSDFLCKELESVYAYMSLNVEIGTDSVRVFVVLYKGLPYTLSDSTYLPVSAVAVLKEKANLTADQVAFLDTHSVALDDTGIISSTPSTTLPASVEHTSTGTVSGKTTFQNLLDWGVSRADIESVIGQKLPATGTSLKDYATQKGLEFSALKEVLQVKVDVLLK